MAWRAWVVGAQPTPIRLRAMVAMPWHQEPLISFLFLARLSTIAGVVQRASSQTSPTLSNPQAAEPANGTAAGHPSIGEQQSGTEMAGEASRDVSSITIKDPGPAAATNDPMKAWAGVRTAGGGEGKPYIVKMVIGATGLQLREFAPHLFRMGAATTSAASGQNTERLKQIGRWAMGVFWGDIRPN
ncbi:hypothetical protein NDU88_006044 [Pleurodeles waltl]|uniref:Uncharacterized protein n=1 Tax=Pleurodeles waltl TaxID=8319 RepID=A0AAV7SNE1_PLEWA|nr:hypothetical protein NDU88_006044 [Pleurodeles waltl]